jgi:hypothetical protein
MTKPISIKLRPGQRREIRVTGARDPRGYDNKIEVWLDESDMLRISVLKPDLCYRFKEVKEYSGMIVVVQE